MSAFTGPKAMQEEDLCRAVAEDLVRQYPGHPWMVGADLDTAGTVVIDLGYEKPAHYKNFAYMLHASTLMGPGGQARVMQAGGELLERFGVGRGAAKLDDRFLAAANGLLADDTDEGAWIARKVR